MTATLWDDYRITDPTALIEGVISLVATSERDAGDGKTLVRIEHIIKVEDSAYELTEVPGGEYDVSPRLSANGLAQAGDSFKIVLPDTGTWRMRELRTMYEGPPAPDPDLFLTTTAAATTYAPLDDPRFSGVVAQYDLRSFLAPGQTFPDNGTLDAAPLINSAIATLANNAAAEGDERIHELVIPAGRFRINTAINLVGTHDWAERLAIRGSGPASTVILPYGSASGVHSPGAAILEDTPQDFWWFRNCHFTDFTIDCRNQTFPEPGGLQKAFQGGGWLECSFESITAIGTTATMFGNDYPVRTTFTNCHAIDAGRGTVTTGMPPAFAEMRSGFGIGFGHYDDESVNFTGCSATGCARSGFFFERQDSRGSLKRNSIIRMIGCEASYNGNGVTDAGCGGIVAENCKFTDNIAAGFYEGPNTQAVQSGIYGRIKGSTFLRNGYGLYMTGSLQDSPADQPVGSGGGYVVEGNRIQDNVHEGLLAQDFELEAGGLIVRGNQFVRNGGYGMLARFASKPLRDLVVTQNLFDGNGQVGLGLLVPMNAPRITDNDFANTDGVARQVDAIVLHPAEPITLPRIQRNTWRRHTRGLVNSARLSQTLITENLAVAAGDDPATAGLYDEYLQTKPDASATTLGAGWTATATGSEPTWVRTAGGCRPTSGTWGALAIQERDLGVSGIYAEVPLPASTQGAAKNRFRGVALAITGGNAIVAGVDDVSTQFGAHANYAMWSVTAGVPTLLWESTVSGLEAHRVALAREPGSTITTMFIDGIPVHTEDVPSIAVSNKAGVAAASGVAGTSGSTPSARLIRKARFLSTVDFTMVPVTLRNMATNPSFELTGGFTAQWGTGGAGTATRDSNAPEAHSGTYSYLQTWSTATSDPTGGGSRITAIENVEVGAVYTLSVWIKSSVARKFRANVTYYNAAGATGSSTGFKTGSYVDVAGATWTRLSVVTDALPAATVSLRLEVSAASTAAGGTVFAIGDTLRTDDVMVTKGPTLVDYFDGATNGGTWTGTAHASASTKELFT